MGNKDSFYEKNRPEMNSLISIWYGLLVGGLNVFLIVTSVKRFVWLAELSWPYQKTPFVELNAYIALTGVAVLLLPFFLAASFLKVGNSANDNQLLGHDSKNGNEKLEYKSDGENTSNGFFRTIWKHGGPTASFIHIVSSFSLLLPQTIMEAVLAKYGHLPQATIWRTDLDFVLSQWDRNAVLSIITTGNLKNERFDSGIFMMDHTPGVISMEYINYALALIVFSIRYPSVFWRANKAFALVFSCQLILNSIHSLLSYSSFAVLYKLHVVGPAEVLHKTPKFILNNHVTLLLYTISAITLFLSSWVFYHYGYLRVVTLERNKTRAHHVTDSTQTSRYGPGWAYFPHCSALAVILSLTATQSPVVYDATLLYKISLDSGMLTFVTSSAIHMLLWIILWLWLTAKTKWNFQVRVSRVPTDGKFKNVEYTRPINEITRTDSCREKRVAFFNADSETDQQFTALQPKSSGNVSQLNQSQQSWTGRTPQHSTEKQNFLEPEDYLWLKGPNFNLDFTPTRNKVTFQDTYSSSRYECSPGHRQNQSKRGTPVEGLSPAFQQDTGDYALLRNGPSLARTSSMRNKVDTMDFQKVPASISTTDSGCSGCGENPSRSESRSTTDSRSSPFRQGNPSIPCTGLSAGNPLFDYTSEDKSRSDYAIYGKLGLQRRDSIRSVMNPRCEGMNKEMHLNPIYESRKVQDAPVLSESPYEAHHLTNCSSVPNPVQANDFVTPIYGYTKQKVEVTAANPSESQPVYYSVNAVKKLQELEKTLLKTSDHNLQRDSVAAPKRNNSFRQVRISEIPTEIPPPSFMYSPCNNNVKLDLFTEPQSPPIPPPLPPLSFFSQVNRNVPSFPERTSSNQEICSPS